MPENFPKGEGNGHPHARSPTDPRKTYPKESTMRHIIITLSKVKEISLKASREKWLVVYRGTPERLSVDYSVETLQVRR